MEIDKTKFRKRNTEMYARLYWLLRVSIVCREVGNSGVFMVYALKTLDHLKYIKKIKQIDNYSLKKTVTN